MPDPDGRRRLTAEDLHAALAGCDSVTEILERVFAARLTAERVRERPETPDAARRVLLCLDDGEGLCLRRSHLYARGEPVLFASLWYVPARLPGARVTDLRTTKQPFGRVMQGLDLKRVLLESRFGPLGGRLALRQRALLLARDGLPVAEVVERFCGRALRDDFEALET